MDSFNSFIDFELSNGCYKGTFEEPEVEMEIFLHEIKTKGVGKISEHVRSLYGINKINLKNEMFIQVPKSVASKICMFTV